MARNRSRRDDDDDDYDDRPRSRRRRDDDDYDDDDDRPRRRRRHEDDEEDDSERKSHAGLIIGLSLLAILVVGGVVTALVVSRNRQRAADEQELAQGLVDGGNPFGGGRPKPNTNTNTPTVDAEGLPLANDPDSILLRLNRRFDQQDFFRYQLELENLRLLKKPDFARGSEVFKAVRRHAAVQGGEPRPGTIAYAAWQQVLAWVSKDDVPELCQMLTAERVPQRQGDILNKLAQFKDPRCAAAVAPFLASTERRGTAEMLLKDLDSTIEPTVLPYLGANNAKETRVAALQVVSQVGTKESAKVVEAMTRDPDLQVNHHAKIVFEKLAKQFNIELDLLAVVKALKDAIAAQNPGAINDCSQQLDKAYRDDHPQRAEVFKDLLEACAINDPKGFGKRASFVGALKWSSKDDLEAICQLLVASSGESVVFVKLKELKDPKCAEVVAGFLTVPLKIGEASGVLKEIGAGAEKAVAPYAMRAAPNGAQVPFATRVAAIELLGDIGTADSAALLRQLGNDPMVRAIANKSLMKLQARTKS